MCLNLSPYNVPGSGVVSGIGIEHLDLNITLIFASVVTVGKLPNLT